MSKSYHYPIDETRFLSIAQAACIVSLSQKTIRRLMDSGEIPFVRIGNSIRIPISWRDELLKVATRARNSGEEAANS